MTNVGLIELLVSLSVQVGVVVAATGGVIRFGVRHIRGDRLWFSGHLAMISITLAALTLPHLRLLAPLPELIHRFSQVVDLPSLAFVILAVWLIGVVLSMARLVIATSQLYLALR